MFEGLDIIFSSLVTTFFKYTFQVSLFFYNNSFRIVELFFRKTLYSIALRIIMGEVDDKQIIKFSGTDPEPTFEVYKSTVEIVSTNGNTTNGVSHIKSSNIVDYCWEERFYSGQLLAVHRGGKYIAYGIYGKAKSQCAIRVVNRETTKRSLMKDAEGMIEDLAFAHTPNTVLLACVDNTGILLVYDIIEVDNEIKSNLILHVLQEDTLPIGITYRLFWCPYIPNDDPIADEPEEDEVSKLLAVTRHNKIELWNVGSVTQEGEKKLVKPGEMKENYLVIEAHSDLITEAVFSPDGTAIATASRDGTSKFYQVYMLTSNEEARCLHEWVPHDGRAVTLLCFLDNHKKYNPDVNVWKYAMTGSEDNTELKIWSCETWQCLQTITFSNTGCDSLKFKVGIDLTSEFIIISDMTNKILYVLELNKEEEAPYVFSVTELRLQYAILSFGIVDAVHTRYHPESPIGLESITIREEENATPAVVVKMFIVQPKSLQNCDIVFPSIQRKHKMISLKNINGEQQILSNGTSVSETISNNLVDIEELTPNLTYTTPPPSSMINLMTPEAFSKHSKPASPEIEETTLKIQESAQLVNVSPPALLKKTEIPSTVPTEPPPPPIGMTSGGSSPSREVEHILSLRDSPYFKPQKELAPPPPQNTRVEAAEGISIPYFDAAIGSVKSDLATLLLLLHMQANDIQKLQEKLEAKEEGNNEKMISTLSKIWKDEVYRSLERVRKDQEKTHNHLSKQIENCLSAKLPSLIQSQFLTTLTPAIKEMKDIIQKEVSKQLTTSDSVLKESINKMVRSKPVLEVLSNCVTNSIRPVMNQMCKELLTDSLPKFEKVCSEMLDQMATVFNNGTAEYMSQVSQKCAERTEAECKVIEDASATLTQATQQFSLIIDKTFSQLESSLSENVSKAVINAVRSTLAAGNPRSRAVTPAAVQMDLQTQLLNLANQGHVNSAFQQALSASDLNLVVFLCEKVPTTEVFTPNGCVLLQHILLSLIQQLSADMTSHSEIKQKYLEEAVMNLDTTNPVTREHMPRVLSALQKQLQLYISNNPMNPLIKKVKMLQMMTQSLLVL